MSARYVVEFRHRPALDDDIQSRHHRFLGAQQDIERPWLLPSDGSISLSDIAGELSSVANLNGVVGAGLKGEVVYPLRKVSYLRDAAQYDDYLAIEFKPENVDYPTLVSSVFPKMLTAFESYRATVYDQAIARADWREIVRRVRESGKDINGRDGVYRINAINYFDRALCERAFSLSPESIVDRLAGMVEDVRILNDGVLVVYSSSVLKSSELAGIDAIVRGWLND